MPISDNFWRTIEFARGGSSPSAPSAHPDNLLRALTPLSAQEVTTFGEEFYQALLDLNRWPVWGAGYVIAGGMSDDSFHYFRSWIIGKGKAAYETALQSPDDLGLFVAQGEEDVENELLEYVAVELAASRGLPDPRDGFTVFADNEPEGTPWDEDSVFEEYPKLAARFG
jgi:hypothetical protein